MFTSEVYKQPVIKLFNSSCGYIFRLKSIKMIIWIFHEQSFAQIQITMWLRLSIWLFFFSFETSCFLSLMFLLLFFDVQCEQKIVKVNKLCVCVCMWAFLKSCWIVGKSWGETITWWNRCGKKKPSVVCMCVCVIYTLLQFCLQFIFILSYFKLFHIAFIVVVGVQFIIFSIHSMCRCRLLLLFII